MLQYAQAAIPKYIVSFTTFAFFALGFDTSGCYTKLTQFVLFFRHGTRTDP